MGVMALMALMGVRLLSYNDDDVGVGARVGVALSSGQLFGGVRCRLDTGTSIHKFENRFLPERVCGNCDRKSILCLSILFEYFDSRFVIVYFNHWRNLYEKMSIMNAHRPKGDYGHGLMVFVLRCEHNAWFIGQTKQRVQSLEEAVKNVSPFGRRWIDLHKPLELKTKYVNCTVFDEIKYVKQYMSYYGIDFVRGGAYCEIVIHTELRKYLEYEINYMLYMMQPHPTAKLSSSLISSELGLRESMTDSVLSNSYVFDDSKQNSKAVIKPSIIIRPDSSMSEWLYEQYVTGYDMVCELGKYIWPWSTKT
jgi:hypothetical protein